MAAEYPPFMFGYGVIARVFAKIQNTPAPDQFTHDYLAYTLGFSREADRAFIPMAKRIGLLSADGTPTELYHRLRDPAQSCAAVAAAMQHGYPMLYAKHADAHLLDRKVIAGLVAEFTGLEPGHASVRAIVGSFIALKKLAGPWVEAESVTERRIAAERRTGRK